MPSRVGGLKLIGNLMPSHARLQALVNPVHALRGFVACLLLSTWIIGSTWAQLLGSVAGLASLRVIKNSDKNLTGSGQPVGTRLSIQVGRCVSEWFELFANPCRLAPGLSNLGRSSRFGSKPLACSCNSLIGWNFFVLDLNRVKSN